MPVEFAGKPVKPQMLHNSRNAGARPLWNRCRPPGSELPGVNWPNFGSSSGPSEREEPAIGGATRGNSRPLAFMDSKGGRSMPSGQKKFKSTYLY